MTNKKKKILRILLIAISVGLGVLFPTIFGGVFFGTKPVNDYLPQDVVLSVLIPVLSSIAIALISERFKVFSINDAKHQLEKQLRNGVISHNMYVSQIKELNTFDMEKKRLEVELKKEKYAVEKEIIEEKVKLENEEID